MWILATSYINTEPITQSADTDRDNLVIIISGISGGVVVLLLMALCLVVVILVAVLIRAKPHKMETKGICRQIVQYVWDL